MKVKAFIVKGVDIENIDETINNWLKYEGISIKYIKQTYIKMKNEVLITIWYED